MGVLSDSSQSRHAQKIHLCRYGGLGLSGGPKFQAHLFLGLGEPRTWLKSQNTPMPSLAQSGHVKNIDGQLTSCWWSGGFIGSKLKCSLQVWISCLVGIIFFSPRWLQDGGPHGHFRLKCLMILSYPDTRLRSQTCPSWLPKQNVDSCKVPPWGAHTIRSPPSREGPLRISSPVPGPSVLESKAWFPGSCLYLVWICGCFCVSSG